MDEILVLLRKMWDNKDMTTTEKTITMIRGLSDSQQIDVQKYIEKISRPVKTRRKVELKKYTEEEFIKLIDESIEQSKNGQVYTWEEDREAVRAKYGF